MKKVILYSLVFLSLATTSCEDFLDTDSPSTFTEDYVFSSEADAAKAVGSIYALFNADPYTSRLSNNFSGNTDIEFGGVSSALDNNRRDIWSFEATAGNGEVERVFNHAYIAINRANESIEGIEKSALYRNNSRMMKQLLGEAYTLRAFWYYYLVNLYGDVPFKPTATKAGDEFYLPKTDRNEILANMIEDLKRVEPDMMWASELDFGIERINRGFVQGFIARLALTRGGYSLQPDMTLKRSGDWQEYYAVASSYAKKLIDSRQHTLNSNYAEIFENINKSISPKNGEVLYEVAFYPGSGDVAWNMGIRVDAGSHPYGSGSNYLSLTPGYYHSFDTLDVRLPATCSLVYYDKNLEQQPVAVTSIAPNKWNRLLMKTPSGPASAKGTGINWPIMRLADVYLMFAEAENALKGGPTAEAKEAFRQVRRRAFPESRWASKVDAYLEQVSGSEQAFFNALVDERAWEFGAEAIRKYDLIRWGPVYGKKIAETKAALIAMGEAANGVPSGHPQEEAHKHLPDYLYYKRNADGTITFLNRYSKVNTVPLIYNPTTGDNPTGYIRHTWLGGNNLYNASTNTTANFILWSWRGYQDDSGLTPVRYILPIPASVVMNSQGVLKNEGYGF
jgi:starch-binding outer membrane protein, SusD/RagB family